MVFAHCLNTDAGFSREFDHNSGHLKFVFEKPVSQIRIGLMGFHETTFNLLLLEPVLIDDIRLKNVHTKTHDPTVESASPGMPLEWPDFRCPCGKRLTIPFLCVQMCVVEITPASPTNECILAVCNVNDMFDLKRDLCACMYYENGQMYLK